MKPLPCGIVVGLFFVVKNKISSLTWMSIVRGLAAIVFVAVAYMLLMFVVVDLPPRYDAGVSVVVALIGFAVVAWAFVPDRKSKP